MVGKDKIEITAELKDLLTGQLKKIQDEASKLDNTLKNIGNDGAIGGKTIGGGIKGSMMGSVLGANLLTQGIGMATSAIKDFAVSSVDAYMKNEMYESRLTTLLHGREQALSALAQITKDASLTPFDKESLVQGNSMLIGAGESASDARKAIMDLGNAIAATGGGSDELSRMSVNLAQIKSIGKASALDVKQFMYANIPIYDMLAKSMHKNVNEIKNMDISYKDLTNALADARKEGGMFYEGLENANKTLSGQVSNLGDSWDQLKTSIASSQSGILKSTVGFFNDTLVELNKWASNSNKLDEAFSKYGAKDFTFGESLKYWFTGNGDKGAILKQQQMFNQVYDPAMASDSKIEKLKAMQGLNYQIIATQKSYGRGDIDKERMERETALLKQMINDIGGSLKGMTSIKNNEGKDVNKDTKSKEASSLEKVAQANRPTQYHINIENLVREYTNTFNSASEALKMTPEQVAKVLISAVNDVSNLKYT